MKIYELKVSKGLSVSMASILSIIIYIAIVAILNLLQELIDPTGANYSVLYGVLQMLIVSIYWILICFLLFSRSGSSGTSAAFLYVFLTVLPILIFTLISSTLIVSFPTPDFAVSWNYLTWIIGPTLFWYLPYSYPYLLFGEYLAFPIFMAIFLLYQILLESIGIILGVFVKNYREQKAQEKLREAAARRRRPQISFEQGNDFTMHTDTNLDLGDLDFGTNPFHPKNEATEADNLPATDDILKNRAEREETEVINRKINEFSRNLRRSVTESHSPEETIEFVPIREHGSEGPQEESTDTKLRTLEEKQEAKPESPLPTEAPAGFESILKSEGVLSPDESLKGKTDDQQ